MILTGVAPRAVRGLVVDLDVLGYDEYDDDAEGLSYEYDLLSGDEKLLRKGVRKEIIRITGRAYLNVRGGGQLAWSNPQPQLDNLRRLRGALVTLSLSGGSGTGSQVGQYQVRSAPIRRRNRRGDEDKFLSVSWELELVGADDATTL